MTLKDDLAIGLDPAELMIRCGLQPDPWQERVLRSQADRQLLLCCRQSGKSTTTASLALHTALYSPGLILLLSPSLRQSQELFRKIKDAVVVLGESVAVTEESALRLEMRNGSRIISLPGTEQTVRGFSGVKLLIIDEASLVADDLYYAIRPMLGVSRGKLICLSTPHGKRGFFHKEWSEGSGWERTKITAADCPRISGEFLQEERQSLGDWWFQQEYFCEFVQNEDQMFSFEAVNSALSADVKPLFEVGT